MKIAVDVEYRSACVVAACVGFQDWTDERAAISRTLVFPEIPAPYEPGEFYKREMPYVTALLARVGVPVELVVVDSFVWLESGRPGFGARLHAALGGRTPVVGVAKRPFRNASGVADVLRGTSHVPIHVSAVGMDLPEAVAAVGSMHGPHRIPTLLREVDRLSRSEHP